VTATAVSDAAHVPLAMLCVFASAKLVRELFERMKQPGIIGEIAAGVLIGPHVLGWIQPGEVLSTLSELGVMFLLFRIGLEVNPADLIRVGGTALASATAGVVVPFFAGYGIALAWGQPNLDALFIGTSIVATSVAITAEVLASRGLLEARASRTILAAAVIDDVLGLIVLALVTSYARGQMNWMEVTLTAGIAIGFTVFVTLWGQRTVRTLVPRVEAGMHASEAQFSIAMAILFGLSALAIYAGVAAIVGAFLGGMALSQTVTKRVHTMTDGVAELLTPFFLVGIGMALDPAVFKTGATLSLAGVLLIVAILSKLVGCGLGAWPLGAKDALRVGVGMAPRGEVGMVVAQIGRRLGVMPDSVFAIVVFLSVATTLVAPPMIRVTFRGALPQPVAPEPDQVAKIG
jgi:Kef-type K+ transport system membrane component KefB